MNEKQWGTLRPFLAIKNSYTLFLSSVDDLLNKDKIREKDGFPRKIRMGKMIKPVRGGKDKVVVVPTTVEEKFIHDPNFTPQQEGEGAGAGEGEEGEIIGKRSVRESEGEGQGPGEGGDSNHEIESSAYDIGKSLTEQFKLPNLKDKGKKRACHKYVYDMTDKNRGFGQILDKKATMRQILKTNIGLGRVTADEPVDTQNLILSPRDKIFRIMSREKEYESQALIFFIRDYSGSMHGKPTELVCSQHVLLYSWLMYQYNRQVETRFLLHDTQAKEVEDFYTYYNSQVAGGTKCYSAFELLNKIVKEEGLDRLYNIYVFYGTDGDDWDSAGQRTIPEIEQMLSYTNRAGFTIVNSNYRSGNSTVQSYLEKSKLLEKHPDLFRLVTISEDAKEETLIDGIKQLIS